MTPHGAAAFLGRALGHDVDWKDVFLTGAAPIFVVVFAIEYRVMRGRGLRATYDWRETLANISLGGAYQTADMIAHVLFVGAIAIFVYDHRLFDIPVNAWTIVPIFVAVEFCYYWFHRTSHRVRWFWSAHVVHHSSERMDLSTALRQSVLYPLTGWWLFFLPLVWLGVPPAVVFVLYGVDLFYQFFVHTESVGRLHPVLEFLLDTPSNHRVHHGRNPAYIDRNYGGVLIVFDRMFGTYVPETERPDYGIVRQVRSCNPVRLSLHEFADMWRDAARPGRIGTRVRHLWSPPEWTRPRKERH